MTKIFVPACVMIALLTSSCRLLPTTAPVALGEGPLSAPECEAILSQAQSLHAAGNQVEAQAVLAPLVGTDFRPDVVTALNAEISAALHDTRGPEPLPVPLSQPEAVPYEMPATETGTNEAVPPEKTAGRRLHDAQALVQAGKYAEAQEELAPLVGTGYMTDTVTALNREIAAKLAGNAQAAGIVRETAGEEREQASKAVRQRLSDVRKLMRNGNDKEAQELLAPLLGNEEFADEIKELSQELNQKRLKAARQAAQLETEQQAMAEVDERMVLPATYGRTLVISKYSEPLELPPGPMEELINKKVTIVLEDAGVKELVQVLSEVDGLNIIADDALTEQKRLNISVRNVPLQEVLSYIARNMGVAFHLGANMIWVTESLDPPGTGPKLEIRIIKIQHGFIPESARSGDDEDGGGLGGGGGGGGDNDLEDVLEAFLTDSPDGATYRIFKNRNLLVIRDSLENLRMVEQLVREFDQPPYQVLIEARFLTIAQEDLSELGFDINEFSLDGKDVDARSKIMTLDSTSTFEAFQNAATGSNLTVTGILGNHTYEAVLHALQTKGRTKTLSAPRVTVLNNQSARIRKGDTLYYFEEYDTETVDGGDTNGDQNILVPSGSPTELELGITLDVKVNVGTDGRTVNLSLNPEVVQFEKWLNFVTTGDDDSSDSDTDTTTGDTGQPNGLVSLPQVNESMVSTTLVVNSGETVVLGGMLEHNLVKTEHKVPLLGDIPLLGYLFKHVEETEEPQHLLIFVTATVIGNDGAFLDVRQTSIPPQESIRKP